MKWIVAHWPWITGALIPFVVLPVIPPVVGALVAALLLSASGCAHNVRPREMIPGERAFDWSQVQCEKARTKKVWLTAVTAGLGALSGAGGLVTVFPETERYRLAIGLPSIALGVASAVTAPFLASASKDLADHCVE